MENQALVDPKSFKKTNEEPCKFEVMRDKFEKLFDNQFEQKIIDCRDGTKLCPCRTDPNNLCDGRTLVCVKLREPGYW
jgi:hypothetical protein